MKTYLLFVIFMLSACGGSTPGQPEPPDAGDGGGVDAGHPIRDCQTAVDCDDGVDCTADACGEDGKCVWNADHTACDNGDMCDGAEQCIVDDGCQPGAVPPPARECRQDVEPKIVLGEYHTCAIDPLGFLYCWGLGINGQLGYGELGGGANVGENPQRVPATVGPVGTPNGEDVPLRYVVDVALGVGHTCALLNTGDVQCWGSHTNGELGYGPLGDDNVGDDQNPKLAAPRPTPIDLGGKAVQIAAGVSKRTCAVLDNGKVRCWGLAIDGELGYPVSEPGGGDVDPNIIVGDNETPASVGDVDVGGNVVQISLGGQHTCALLDDGNVRCWGQGEAGALGYGSTEDYGDQETPAAAGNINMGGVRVLQIAAGGTHTCALLEGGTVRCWGRANEGQLGYGMTTFNGDQLLGNEPGETPAEIGDVNVGGTVVQITAGGQHTCALLDDGGVRCWGTAFRGVLGYSNLANIGDNETPADVGNVNIGEKAVRIVAGGFHTCALLETGNVRCWGFNDYGQLGYGNETMIGDTEAPVSAGDVLLGVSLLE
jgi:alpha-tubulin suppressor-like RCC1 family protein